MKRFAALLGLISMLLCGCTAPVVQADIAATTLPVYQFTAALCEGTGLTVSRLITENVSCLHDYTLQVAQVKTVEQAKTVIISGAGLEAFMEDLLAGKETVDASEGIALLDRCHGHAHGEAHHHGQDAHIWLSPANAMTMARNICNGLCKQYPQHAAVFRGNLEGLLGKLTQLQQYAQVQLGALEKRELITFHDGFSYMSQAFDLQILAAVEEESGAEASAKALISLIKLVQEHDLKAIFTEVNGAVSAAQVIAAETNAGIFSLDMAMAGDDYFEAMYKNIDCIREALS